MRMPFRIMGILLLLFFIVGGFTALNQSCSNSEPTPPPKTYTPPTPPNLTAQQAIGVVIAAVKASTPTIQRSAGWFETEFNYSSRQWMITVWASEEDSKKYAGSVYIIDDATGKVLNPPPVYNPKSSQSTQSSEPTLTAPIVPSTPTVPPAAEAPLVPTGSQVIESRIDGEFQGWDGETIFRLTNGQIWQQAEYSYLYHYAYMPRVTIFSVSGGYKMQVDGVNKAIRVQRLR